ncbi:MAG: apolipoprotein N-acyltransferase, partial [bacterium]
MTRAALLTLASALLHALAFPPWDWWPLAFIALVPFFAALDGASVRRAAWLGLLWGVAAHWAEAAWVLPAMRDYYQ